MQREVATTELDRPHAYVEISAAKRQCVCGRWSDDELHGAKARELAADTKSTPALVTEKGT